MGKEILMSSWTPDRKDKGTTIFRNVGKDSPKYKVQHPEDLILCYQIAVQLLQIGYLLGRVHVFHYVGTITTVIVCTVLT